jgi:predicted metalloprotease with PDZ domain
MRSMKMIRWIVTGAAALAGLAADAQNPPIVLQVDATDAPRNILRARLRIPALPGPLTLVYPKWIPGEHGPTGPITDLTGLKMSAAGHPIEWQRDDDDMFAFHLEVPAGADAVDVSLDFLLPPNSGEFSSGGSSTAQLLDLSWNQVLLYPQGGKPGELQYSAALLLPKGWEFGTALTVAPNEKGIGPFFKPVSLETLVDSPVIAGTHYRSIDLTPKGGPLHELDIVADSAAALEIKPEDSRHFAHLVTETGALFGARHYRSYHFLLTLSDHVAHFGLEHHESSDDREGEKYLTDEDDLMRGAFLLSHEMVHSWNGKYRRPAGLATSDYQQPMKGELLWVYEGLTDYLGVLLAARCGLWTNENFREYIALEADALDRTPGRNWRSLADTAVAAQLLYESRPEGEAWRRTTDFYEEGDLIWLEADVIIRQQTQGKRSLDDFCRRFHGGLSGPPQVVPYSREDVVAALNEVAPYDWGAFIQQRVYATNPRAPLGGIEGGGWRLTYTNTVPALLKARESLGKYTDMRTSLGFTVKEDGYILDVIPGSPADKAGVGTAMKLVAVNDRRWTPEILRAAIKAAVTDLAPVALLVENDEYFKTCKLDYHEGEKYAQLERDPSKPDLLSDILKPLTPP